MFTNFNKKIIWREICMLAQWIGEIVGQMHNNKVSKAQLAEHIGVSREYVSMILNGHRCPVGVEERFRAAVSELVEKNKEEM
jgi:hypothetical protein